MEGNGGYLMTVEYYPRICLEILRKITINGQYCRYPGRDSNQRLH
jgi:hypothetical protein